MDGIGSTSKIGVIIIWNETLGPSQPLKLGVTVIVAVSIEEPEVVVVNEGISPDPLEASPISVLSLIQEYIAPVTFEVNIISSKEQNVSMFMPLK